MRTIIVAGVLFLTGGVVALIVGFNWSWIVPCRDANARAVIDLLADGGGWKVKTGDMTHGKGVSIWHGNGASVLGVSAGKYALPKDGDFSWVCRAAIYHAAVPVIESARAAERSRVGASAR